MTTRTHLRIATVVLAAVVAGGQLGACSPPRRVTDGGGMVSASIPGLPLAEWIEKADVIALGEVTSIGPSQLSPATGSSRHSIAFAVFRTSQLLKGDPPGQTVQVATAGGPLEGAATWVEDSVSLSAGQEYLMLLSEYSDGTMDAPGEPRYYSLVPLFLVSEGRAVTYYEEQVWELDDLIRYIEMAVEPPADPDAAEYLMRRYQELGVEAINVRITDETPLTVEVKWRLTGTRELSQPEDAIHEHIVRREIGLAALKGYPIQAFTEMAVEYTGEVLARESGSVPQLEGWALDTTPALISDEQAAELVRQGLESSGLEWIDVYVENEDGLQSVDVRVAAGNADVANQILPGLVGSLRPALDAANTQGAHIVSCRLGLSRPHDPAFDYILDLRLEMENWWTEEGITSDWAPQPAPLAPGSTAESSSRGPLIESREAAIQMSSLWPRRVPEA